MKKNLLIFISETFACGLFGFLGSVLGHYFGQVPLFIGGTFGGMLGIVVTTLILCRMRVISPSRSSWVMTLGIAAFLIAAVLALTNLHTPVIPLLSLALVGMGCIIGSNYPEEEESKKLFRHAFIGFIALCPALYFVIGSLIKYNLHLHHTFTILDWFQANPVRQHYFNALSPFLFIGGLLLCVLLNGSTFLHLHPLTLLSINKTAKLPKVNLLMALLSGLLITTLMLYVVVENM